MKSRDILISMDSQWLKEQFDCNPDKSKAGLARALNLEPPAISKILNGTRQIKAQEYNLMRQYFGLPIDGENASGIPDNSYKLETLAGGNQGFNESDKSGWSQILSLASMCSLIYPIRHLHRLAHSLSRTASGSCYGTASLCPSQIHRKSGFPPIKHRFKLIRSSKVYLILLGVLLRNCSGCSPLLAFHIKPFK